MHLQGEILKEIKYDLRYSLLCVLCPKVGYFLDRPRTSINQLATALTDKVHSLLKTHQAELYSSFLS